ncbi:hypothetical protein OG413_45085 [Streptomyces sp. NBC_01433]|uniref:hypothetical protein n=1 Tax=Streptomyces sp. NBC_01433 TaxID=2903864 RepID=UPI0022576E80|nr:hypothetical protein [Streptomyces sp. NBC_01433]MCX4682361.1 hypothetical protein [Streptomyces sp. NBC_01433]
MPMYRAHLTWVEGPAMYLTVHVDDEAGDLDVEAGPEMEHTLDVPADLRQLDEAKTAAASVLAAAGWHLHGDWADEPVETTVPVARTLADYDETDLMADIPHPQVELDAKLREVYGKPEVRAGWRDRPYTGPKQTADERAAYLRENGIEE